MTAETVACMVPPERLATELDLLCEIEGWTERRVPCTECGGQGVADDASDGAAASG